MKKYLLYVRKYSIMINDYKMYVYICETNDVLHTIGEMYYRSLEAIKRITFVDYSKEREEYLLAKGYEIYNWYNKYENVIL